MCATDGCETAANVFVGVWCFVITRWCSDSEAVIAWGPNLAVCQYSEIYYFPTLPRHKLCYACKKVSLKQFIFVIMLLKTEISKQTILTAKEM